MKFDPSTCYVDITEQLYFWKQYLYIWEASNGSSTIYTQIYVINGYISLEQYSDCGLRREHIFDVVSVFYDFFYFILIRHTYNLFLSVFQKYGRSLP